MAKKDLYATTPQNLNCEIALIGAVLFRRKALDEVKDLISSEDFYSNSNKIIWEAILDLSNNAEVTVDLVTLCDYLNNKGIIEDCGGVSYVASLTNSVPASTNAEYYARIIKRLSLKRSMLELSEKIKTDALTETTEVGEALNNLRKQLEALEKDEYKSSLSTQSYKEKNNVLSNFDNFVKDIEREENCSVYSTGFYKLDKELDGGIKEGLTTLGAVSSLGKTTFSLQLADHIAESGTDVIFISLEQSKTELMSKSISRITGMYSRGKNNGLTYALTQNQIQEGKRHKNFTETQRDVYNWALESYKNICKNLYIFEASNDFSVEDVKRIVKSHIGYTGRKPFVVLDYLQLLEPLRERLTDKQAVDLNVKELKQLTRDYKIAILCISSFNRGSYNSQASMSSLKESGTIEYSSDVALGLQYRGVGLANTDSKAQEFEDEASKKNPREVQIRVMKNRRSSKGGLIDFNYYSTCNLYSEA